MKRNLTDFPQFLKAIQENELVWLCGAGMSAALTGKAYSWRKWIEEGIALMGNRKRADELTLELSKDNTADGLVAVAGEVIRELSSDGKYHQWMQAAFESSIVSNLYLAATLRKLLVCGDAFATTNYDSSLEEATGLGCITYQDAAIAFKMLDERHISHIIHLHGAYRSSLGIDNIIASSEQYESVLNDEGAQFVQHILGTRTLIFAGCGQTTDDVNISKFIAFAKDKLRMDVDYYFLVKDGWAISGIPENIHVITYGDEYSDLQDFLEDIAQCRLKAIMSRNPIIGRTTYETPDKSSDTLLTYHYSAESIPFCGREKELKELHIFIDGSEKTKWWAITGQAGSGKSRLALQFLHELPASWFGFFLNDMALSVKEKISPFSDTLVIIDYVAGRESIISGLMTELSRIFATSPYKLRLLLIERDNSRESGSWYAKLMQFSGRYENLAASEHKFEFLYLEDLDEIAVEHFIGLVCKMHGLEPDDMRDADLRREYGRKFEQLQYRPLFVQMFIEAWIENNCTFPTYDSFDDLLRLTLNREQRRWLDITNGSQIVCNALIRLIVRANISGTYLERDADKLYREDWNTFNKFIADSALPGVQGEEWKRNALNSICQNTDTSNKTLTPLYPDILKEYMFYYYTDRTRLPSVMNEIWLNASHDFRIFIMRCLTDFPNNGFYKEALNTFDPSTFDLEAMLGRLTLMNGQKGLDESQFGTLWNLILNEYELWKSFPENVGSDEEKERLCILKISALSLIAEQAGSFATTNLDFYMEIIDEMLKVGSGKVASNMKKIFLQREIAKTAEASFFVESEILREKLSTLLSDEEGDIGLDKILELQTISNAISNLIISNRDYKSGQQELRRLVSKCDRQDQYSVITALNAGKIFDSLAFQMNDIEYCGIGAETVKDLLPLFPEVTAQVGLGLFFKLMPIQLRYFTDSKKRNSEVKAKIEELVPDAKKISFDGLYSDNISEDIWSMYHILRINFFTTIEEYDSLIREVNSILESHPLYAAIAQTKVIAIYAKHKSLLRDKVTKDEVNDCWRHVKENPDSESLRERFFNMLLESTEKDNIKNYLEKGIMDNVVRNILFNPMSDGGFGLIAEALSGKADILDEMYDSTPFVRKYRKIGANEPCPCGSGKKFKKCCRGKGFWD